MTSLGVHRLSRGIGTVTAIVVTAAVLTGTALAPVGASPAGSAWTNLVPRGILDLGATLTRAPAQQIFPAHTGGLTTRVSVASDGTEADLDSFRSVISADGRFVAFESEACNLAPGVFSARTEIFLHDRVTGVTTQVNVASDGTQGNAGADSPSISGDGRYVAFPSGADNLVPNDTNDSVDVFVRDTLLGLTTRVSVASDGTEGNGISGRPSISADGRYVAFHSDAGNLVPGDTNNSVDVFVHDRQTGETTRVSLTTGGIQGNMSSIAPAISADGRIVAFTSFANNLVPGDTNNRGDVFAHDRLTGETTRVSVDSGGGQSNDTSERPSISADGRFVAFESDASNLVSGDTNGRKDVFVHDRQTGQTTRVSVSGDGAQGNHMSQTGAISGDGRYVTFHSWASNLVPEDTNNTVDVFVHDRQTAETVRVNVSSEGAQANEFSQAGSISADGSHVTFSSLASNLVPGDTNGVADIFVHDRRYLRHELDIIAGPAGHPNPVVSGGSVA